MALLKHTREVTLPLARAIAAVSNSDTIAGIPLCKEFQQGKASSLNLFISS